MCTSLLRQTDERRSPAKRPLTVCVVDPQASDYDGWDSLAKAHDARLHFAANAEVALRIASTEQIDLWVVNTELPGLSGFELCNMLKTRPTRAAVYLVADHYSADAEREAWRARATSFGYKPTHRTWLEEWLALRSGQMAPNASANASPC
jgi:CheY-like chemotaxis protein